MPTVAVDLWLWLCMLLLEHIFGGSVYFEVWEKVFLWLRCLHYNSYSLLESENRIVINSTTTCDFPYEWWKRFYCVLTYLFSTVNDCLAAHGWWITCATQHSAVLHQTPKLLFHYQTQRTKQSTSCSSITSSFISASASFRSVHPGTNLPQQSNW